MAEKTFPNRILVNKGSQRRNIQTIIIITPLIQRLNTRNSMLAFIM